MHLIRQDCDPFYKHRLSPKLHSTHNTFILYLLRIIEINFLLPHQACRLMLPEYKEAHLLWNIVCQQQRTRYLCLNPKVWMKFWQNRSIVYCLQADTVPRIYTANQTQRSVLFLYRDNRLAVLSVIRPFPFSCSPNSSCLFQLQQEYLQQKSQGCCAKLRCVSNPVTPYDYNSSDDINWFSGLYGPNL